MMCENIVCVDFTWLPSASEIEKFKVIQLGEKSLNKNDAISPFRNYLSRVLCCKVDIRDFRPATSISYQVNTEFVEEEDEVTGKKKNTLDYVESLYIVSCNLIVEKDAESCKKYLINLFCSQTFSPTNPEFWASLDVQYTIGAVELEHYMAFRKVNVREFGLGNLVGLSTFAQHFDSSSSLSKHSPYRITNITMKFTDEMLEIKFTVGDSNVSVSKRNATTHRKFLMTLNYTALHRLLICETIKDGFTMYLYFLECPLLYGAKVTEPCEERYYDDNNQGDSNRNSEPRKTAWVRELELHKGCPPDLKSQFSMNSVLRLKLTRPEYTFLGHLLQQYCRQLKPCHTSMQVVPILNKVQISALTSEHFNCFYALKCLLTRNYEVNDQLVVRKEAKELNDFFVDKREEDPAVLMQVLIQIHNQMNQGSIILFTRAVKELYDKMHKSTGNSSSNSLEKSKHKEGNLGNNLKSSGKKSKTSAGMKNSSTKSKHLDEKSKHSNNNLKLPDVKLKYLNEKSESEHPDEQLDSNSKNDIMGKIKYVKRAIVTPTHVRFLPSHPQLYNRILLNTEDKGGHLMRITIRDTDLSRIDFNLRAYGDIKYKKEFLKVHYQTKLLRGITVGNRKYEYLGMSSSQLKSHSAWCYAKGETNVLIDEIRKNIGDLSQIHDVPKYMARLGLSFSQSMGRIRLPQHYTNIAEPETDVCGDQKVYMSDDESVNDDDSNKKHLKGKYRVGEEEQREDKYKAEGEFDPYVFSDGIGRMSPAIAKKISQTLGLEEDMPSAVQIRYAGCKGMLAVDPSISVGDQVQVFFRKSMKKYDSEDKSLEILKISKPRIVYLNRPLVTILEQKGIVKETFIKLQKRMIHNLIKSMFYDEDAQKILTAKSELRLLNFTNLLNAGISFTEDPLFRSMILAIFKTEMTLLKHKSRIAIPENEGRNMFGVLDETKTLEYGEIFIQYTKFNTKITEVLEGTVVVTKSPCLHLGDVRKFTARDVEALRHHKDCIVFPAKGHRPHPDEMAGSDLDGDEYTVIWCDELIFDDQNSPPMHYSVPKKKGKESKAKPINTSDELNHFFDFILNDTVGCIANTHLARADYEGLNSDICVKLAKKHAKAVDFAKTGQVAIMGRFEVTRKYPDFMEKNKRGKTYISGNALGHLYRNCKNLEIGLEATTDRMEFHPDPNLCYEGWQEYQKSALKTYRQYCKKMNDSLHSYCFENEGEFLSGSFVKRSKLWDNSEFRNQQELLEHDVKWLCLLFEKKFFAEFGGKPVVGNDVPKYTPAMLKKASAWYMVTYTDKNTRVVRYFGLPWMVSDVLAAIKRNRMNFSLAQSSNIFVKKASYVEEAIDKAIAEHIQAIELVDDDVFQFKNEIADVSRLVLDKWLDSQKQNFMHSDERLVQKCIDDEFKCVIERLLTSDDDYILECRRGSEERKAFSPGYYVLTTLIRISEMGTGHEDINASFSSDLQEFGLAAWVTLIRLACSCNVKNLGLYSKNENNDEQKAYLLEDIIVDWFHIDFKDKKFQEMYRKDEEGIKKYFTKMLNLKEVAVRPEELHQGGRNQQFLRLMVKGSRYSIDRLKEMVVDDNFVPCIIENKPFKRNIKPMCKEH